MTQYFPKPYEPFDGNINVKVDLSNYATKTDIKLLNIIKLLLLYIIKLLNNRYC